MPAEVFPPGEYLRDELSERGWSERDFAEILDRPTQAVSEILNGRKQITAHTAIALAQALGTSPDLWLNLQTAYDLHEARSQQASPSPVSRRARLRALVPVAELRRRGWLPDTSDVGELEDGVKTLLGIRELDQTPVFAAAARRVDAKVAFTPQQTAWLARFRYLAATRKVAQFDAAAIETLAADIVHRIHGPEDLAKLESWLSECGIVLITLLPLRACKLDGAAMMLEGGTAAIGLTSRGDRMDAYVFTLLHEMAHLHLGHLKDVGLRVDEDLSAGENVSRAEGDANRQAAEWILPQDAELPLGRPRMATVLKAADRYRIHVSFVIGRVQRTRQDWAFLRRSIPPVRNYVRFEV